MNSKKKVGLTIAGIVLILLAGLGGWTLGRASLMPSNAKEGKETRMDLKKVMQNLTSYRALIDENYLYDYKEEEIENGIYKGYIAGLQDPYSEYFTPDEYRAFMDETTGNFDGVGLKVGVEEDNRITVISAFEGSPAAKAGIRTGDKILAVDGKEYLGENLSEAAKAMRGKAGTEVAITYRRGKDDQAEEKTVTMKREKIVVDTVRSEILKDKIGYLVIDSFDEGTGKHFAQHLKELEKQGASRLILDLRNNGGGLIDSCEEVADQLLGKATIVTVVDKKGKKEVASSDPAHDSIPMVVLVNEGSASASEILVGALRDHHRALIIGDKTFGKGIVQKLYPLTINGEEAGLKLTMAEYLTPSGDHIHKKGIEPDISVSLPEGVTKMGTPYLSQDTQLIRAIQEVKKLNSEKVKP